MNLDQETILYPETLLRQRLPVNLKQADLDLFVNKTEKVIPQTKLCELHNIRVSSDGFLFKGLKILPESFAYSSNLEQWNRRSVLKFFLENHLIKKRRRFTSDAVWIVDDWSSGYFHWLADALPRLFLVRDRLDQLVLLLPAEYAALEFIGPSLKPFGVRKLEFIDEREVLLCDRLFVPTQTAPSGYYNEQIITGVRDLLVEQYGGESRTRQGERLYISRSRARKRKIINEEEVCALLRQLGFRIIHAEDHPFEAQVEIAAGATHLVSNHGAGLMNMLFMQPGNNVLELRLKEDDHNNCYFHLASALELNYFYQTCAPEKPGESAHTANLLVDAEELKNSIQLMLQGHTGLGFNA